MVNNDDDNDNDKDYQNGDDQNFNNQSIQMSLLIIIGLILYLAYTVECYHCSTRFVLVSFFFVENFLSRLIEKQTHKG